MRHSLGAGLILLCALPLALAAPLADTPLQQARAAYWLHPYQPAAINRLALALLADGDRATAEILLARAVRIAPDRDDLRANLQRLRAGATQVETNPAAAPPAASAPAPDASVPRLWKAVP